mgnify:CR=1 FL=1
MVHRDHGAHGLHVDPPKKAKVPLQCDTFIDKYVYVLRLFVLEYRSFNDCFWGAGSGLRGHVFLRPCTRHVLRGSSRHKFRVFLEPFVDISVLSFDRI